MQIFKNVYIILLSLIMPFVFDIQNEAYGMLSICYGIIAGIIFANSWLKSNKNYNHLKELHKKLESSIDYIKAGNGIIAISNMFRTDNNIPEIFTIKSIIYPIKASLTDEILPYVRNNKVPDDLGMIELLDSILIDFDYKSVIGAEEEILGLNEFKNIFFLKENVSYIICEADKEINKGDKLLELLHKVTESMPFINIGIATTLLFTSSSSESSESVFITEGKIAEILDNYNSNNGWYLPYQNIDCIKYPYKMTGIHAVKTSMTIINGEYKYELNHFDEKYDFKDDLFEQLIFVNILNRQFFFPHKDKTEVSFERCELVPHTEIEYDE
ncbi:MAG: hypothetical protein NTY07_16890 [Bacteroidia bacterium]|nr:hypothetical protein [Bacteroidia bacterium]